MTLTLAASLKHAYENAPKGKQIAALHVFCLNFADKLKQYNVSAVTLVRLAGLPKSLATEVRKCLVLSEYVNVNKTGELFLQECAS